MIQRQESLSYQGSVIQAIAAACYLRVKHGAVEVDTGPYAIGIHTLIEECHTRSVNAGWYTDIKTKKPLQLNLGERIALMHSEVSEMAEGLLSGNPESDKLIGYTSEEEEAADVLIRLADYAGYRDLRLGGAVLATFNSPEAFKLSSAVEMIVLMHCHLSVMLEGVRKQPATEGGFTLEELAAARLFVHLLAYSVHRCLRLDTAYIAKLKYNETRADHKLENRAKVDGKAF